jgi:hypothetical protein
VSDQLHTPATLSLEKESPRIPAPESVWYGEERHLFSLMRMNLGLLGCPAHTLVTILTELSLKIIFILLNEYGIIAQLAHRRATGWTAGFRFPAGARDLSLLHSVNTGPGAHPASYPMGTRGGAAGE